MVMGSVLGWRGWTGFGGGLCAGEAGGGKRGQRQQGSSLHGSLFVLWVGAMLARDKRLRRAASMTSASERKSPLDLDQPDDAAFIDCVD
jgi:hypothetical protein